MAPAKFGQDPLDKLVVVVLLAVLACLAALLQGLVWPGLVFLGLVLVAYCLAPRRRFPTAERVCGDCEGQVVLVTGVTSGIGFETARVLALNGADVVLAARSERKLAEAKAQIAESCAKQGKKARLTTIGLDLDDLGSVKKCATEFLALGKPLHVLVNNAGIMALPSREETKQGLEKQMGVCHVAHFLLFRELLPALLKAKQARVVALTSVAHRLHDQAFLDSPQLETSYRDWTAYGNAKLANLLFASEVDKRYAGQGLRAFAVHPGGIHSGLQGHVDAWTMFKWLVVTPFFFKSVPQGAATTVHCATRAPRDEGGLYFDNCAAVRKVTEKYREQLGADAGSKLWAATEKLLQGHA